MYQQHLVQLNWGKKIIDPIIIGKGMPKSLGQIHTTKFNYETASDAIGVTNAFLCDNSAKLSNQFNRNIRMMQTYKWVGADLVVQLPENVNPSGGESLSVQVKGRMRYFAPTKGRCQALRDAYNQFRAMAKTQGVNPSVNRLFDFRVIPRGEANYTINADALNPDEVILNLTTLDGSNPLVMTDGAVGTTVFDTYNDNVRPRSSTVVPGSFSSGLDTWPLGSQTDFVVNEGLIQSGNPDEADLELEEIPFVLTYDVVDPRSLSLQWRPDPALYVSVLGGFVEIVLDEITASGATGLEPVNGVEVDIAMHWAGWKSIVQKPKSRRMRKTSKRRKK